MKKKDTDISIIATFHNEGLVAHKTILNIMQLLRPLEEKHKLNVEIIFHLDNPDIKTATYFKNIRLLKQARIFVNSFKDPSSSRNFAISKAKGKYIALLDGDDIYSPNWLVDGYQMLQKEASPVILHAEYEVTFGYNEEAPRIWHMKNSFSLEEDFLIMFGRNRWSAGIILPKNIATKYPYEKTKKGFGYEDWTFNMETRLNGIEHLIVPDSVQFYRIRNDSIYHSHINDMVAANFVNVYSIKETHKMSAKIGLPQAITNPPTPDNQISPIREIIKGAYHIAKSIPFIEKIAKNRFEKASINAANRKLANLPEPIKRAYLEANKIDSELYLNKTQANGINYYDSEKDLLGKVYIRLVQKIQKEIDYLFLPSSLFIGGTEKVISNYIKVLAEQHPEWHIAILSSISREFYNIPDNVDIIDFWGEVEHLAGWDRDFLLSRLIVECKVKRLHIIHNELAMRWINNHKDLVKTNHIKVYVSQFMYEYNPDITLKVGLIDPYLREIFPVVEKIFTDNYRIIQELIEFEAFDKNKLSVHYQPIEISKKPIKQQLKRPDKLRILWASRVAEQKRPDLLIKIADKLNPDQYIIDVYGRIQAPIKKNIFNGHKTINYHGTYNGIASLDVQKYDVFLYTSQVDGLPNVIIEMAQLGIPIIASKTGGVVDLVKENTGVTIDIEDINAYVDAIIKTKSNYKEAYQKAQKAQELVNSRHTWKNFATKCKEDIT